MSVKVFSGAALAACIAFAAVGCRQSQDADAAASGARPAAAEAAQPGEDGRDIPVIDEAFRSAMTPDDNIDSVAAWESGAGALWVVATAKSSHRLVVYDGHSGETLRTVGTHGSGDGEFDRPNGIAVVDDLAFVVERDNHRVQVLRLPEFEHVLSFAAEDLVKPYGLWINRVGGRYEVYVTDSYHDGEDAHGEDVLPALADLDRRVRRYAVSIDAAGASARLTGSFGDTTELGALRVVESLWGDPDNDVLLIAEEDETYANELKAYDLEGRFSGRVIGSDVFEAQSEGIMLKTCGNGAGWWITTEQGKGRTVFHLFDRVSLDHVGAVTGRTVANTDGIWLHDDPTDRFPDGVLYAVHDDQGLVAFDWRDVAGALSLPACARP